MASADHNKASNFAMIIYWALEHFAKHSGGTNSSNRVEVDFTDTRHTVSDIRTDRLLQSAGIFVAYRGNGFFVLVVFKPSCSHPANNNSHEGSKLHP